MPMAKSRRSCLARGYCLRGIPFRPWNGPRRSLRIPQHRRNKKISPPLSQVCARPLQQVDLFFQFGYTAPGKRHAYLRGALAQAHPPQLKCPHSNLPLYGSASQRPDCTLNRRPGIGDHDCQYGQPGSVSSAPMPSTPHTYPHPRTPSMGCPIIPGATSPVPAGTVFCPGRPRNPPGRRHGR